MRVVEDRERVEISDGEMLGIVVSYLAGWYGASSWTYNKLNTFKYTGKNQMKKACVKLAKLVAAYVAGDKIGTETGRIYMFIHEHVLEFVKYYKERENSLNDENEEGVEENGRTES